jgi:hypothetical protein
MGNDKTRSKQVYKKNTKDKITTIKLDKKTKDRLEHLREHKETYNEIINKALNILNICLKNPYLANKILRDMERGRKLGNLLENPEKILKRNKNLENSIKIKDAQNNFSRTSPQIRTINPSLRRPIITPQADSTTNISLPKRIPPKFQNKEE